MNFIKRHLTAIYLIVITIVFAVSYTGIFDHKMDLNGDNLCYYALGEALEKGDGFTSQWSLEDMPHTHFPPGYPAFISVVMQFTHSTDVIKAANGVLLFISILLLFFIAKRLTNIHIAAVTSILAALHFELLRYGTIIMSETLYMTLTLAAILLIITTDFKRIFVRKGRRGAIVKLSLLFLILGYIYFVRTMGVSFILAVMGLYALRMLGDGIGYLRRREKRWLVSARMNLVLLLIVTAPLLIAKTSWDLRNRAVGKTNNDYIGDFMNKGGGEKMTSFADWSERIGNNTGHYLHRHIPYSLVINDGTEETGTLARLCILALIVAGIFFLRMKKGRTLIALYLAVTFAVLVVWPEQFGGIRYFLATVPLLILLFIWGIVSLLSLASQKFLKKPHLCPISIGVALLMLFIFVPRYGKASADYRTLAGFKEWNGRCISEPFMEYFAAIRTLKENTPPDSRVLARKVEIYHFYSDGRRAKAFPNYASPEEMYDRLVRDSIQFIIVDRVFPHAYRTLLPVIDGEHRDQFRLVSHIGGGERGDQPATFIFEFNPSWGYTGEKKEGKRNGKGSVVLNDGSGRRFVGTFKDDQIDGYGELYAADGTLIVKGIWEQGEFKKEL